MSMDSRASCRSLYIRTSEDALVVYEAARLQHISTISSNLSKAEYQSIKAGDVFVWYKGSSLDGQKSVLRWLDGKKWGASRQSFGLTLADELDSDGRIKVTSDALVRVIHRVILNSASSSSLEDDEELGSYHLAAYNLRSGDMTLMNDVTSDPVLTNITVPEKLYIQPGHIRSRRSIGRRTPSMAPRMRTPSVTPGPSLPATTPDGRRSSRIPTTPKNPGLEFTHHGMPSNIPSPLPAPASSVPRRQRMSVDIPPLPGFPSRIPVPKRTIKPQPAPIEESSKVEPIPAAKPTLAQRVRTFKVDGQHYSFSYFSSENEYPLPFGPPEIPQALLSGDGSENAAVVDGDVYIHEHTLKGEESTHSCWVRVHGAWQTATEGIEHPIHPSMRLRIRNDKTPGWVTAASFTQYKSVEKKRKREEMEEMEQDLAHDSQDDLLIPPSPRKIKELPSNADQTMEVPPQESDVDMTIQVKMEEDDDGLLLPPVKRSRVDPETPARPRAPGQSLLQRSNRKKHGKHESTPASSRSGIIGWAKSVFRWKW